MFSYEFCHIIYELESATHQKTPTLNMKGRKDSTDDRKRQGQHKKTQILTYSLSDKTKQKCPYSTSYKNYYISYPMLDK